jgi:hypothetical protein
VDASASNPWHIKSHRSYLYTMGTATGVAALTLNPPSTRVLTLAEVTFSRWQESWYRGREQQEMQGLRAYAKQFFKAHEDQLPAGCATPKQGAAHLMASSIVLRKAWSVRLALGMVLVSDEYGRRGVVNSAEVEADPAVAPRYGSDTYYLHPLELLVGAMPQLSLGEGKVLIDYARPDEAWPNFKSGHSYASGVGHIVPGYDIALRLGINGMLTSIGEAETRLGDKAKAEFYEASRLALTGVKEHWLAYEALAQRHLDALPPVEPGVVDAAAAERANLTTIVGMMSHLGQGHAPRNFQEAAQMVGAHEHWPWLLAYTMFVFRFIALVL